MCDDVFEQSGEMPEHPLDRRALEEIDIEVERNLEQPVQFLCKESECLARSGTRTPPTTASYIAASPDLSWSNLLPYDNATDTYGIHSLVCWILKPGQEVFLVFNEPAQRENGAVSPLFQDVALRLEYTIRF